MGSLRNVSDAIRTAALVMRHTRQTLLVGSQASDFAAAMGVPRRSLTTAASAAQWRTWHAANCQPNFWVDVTPDPSQSCGPYSIPHAAASETRPQSDNGRAFQDGVHGDHDTIAMVAVDAGGHMAAGTSTNGLTAKVPGRVGDAAIPGAAAYAVTGVGGCGATGDGDVMMRFVPCYQVRRPLQQHTF